MSTDQHHWPVHYVLTPLRGGITRLQSPEDPNLKHDYVGTIDDFRAFFGADAIMEEIEYAAPGSVVFKVTGMRPGFK